MALDATLVRELTKIFPTLTTLVLTEISCSSPSPHHPGPQTDPESELGSPSESVPMQLEHLIIECNSILSPRSNYQSESESCCQWSLSGMMHILSLLASNAVTVNIMDDGTHFQDAETFNPSYSTAKPAVQDLRLSWETPNKSLSEKVLNALSVSLARDCLESVEMMYDSKLALRALSTLLAAGAPRRGRYELGG